MTTTKQTKSAKQRAIKHLLIVALVLQCWIFYRMIQTEALRSASGHSHVAPYPIPSAGASTQMVSFGPFVPYPISWPKMSGAILLFKDDPEIGITPEEARQLIPLFEQLDAEWDNVRAASDTLQSTLSEAQQKYIADRQTSYQLITLPVAPDGPQDKAGPLPPIARSYGLAEAVKTMRKSSKEADVPIVSTTLHFNINLWDMMHGLIDLDDQHDPLRARGKQAARILAIIEAVDGPLKRANIAEDGIRNTLTPAQLEYLVNHMPEITEKKRNAAKSIDHNPVPRIHDPLLSLVMEVLEAKAPHP